MICPIMSYSNNYGTTKECAYTNCMWYDCIMDECAILLIAKELNKLRKEV
jgi:hypothetical protein